MIPEWYSFPVFYFSNHRAIYGSEDLIPYPYQSQALDLELEMACIIGQAGRDIKAEQASDYIAGYTIMNDWSARDLQMEEMKLSMGPVKGKDFATSLGPWLVTPDELSGVRIGSGAHERYDLTMTARLNGKEISRGNFKDIYFSFPQMIERASLNAWVVPGDILGSGTVGTGCLLEQGDSRERYLRPDDVLELEIERLGLLRNRVVANS
jgi:fumarylacetoacetate (FAA) hydrolase